MFDRAIYQSILGLNIGVAQAANKTMFRLLSRLLPLRVIRIPSGREHNGWVVPHDWVVRKALITKNGRTLFDGKVHPLAVAGYSCSFRGVLSKRELDRHIVTSRIMPRAYPFHCRNNYRPWAREWAFCIPHHLWSGWGKGRYHVDLETEYRPGSMLVAEHLHRGSSSETIVFNAHTCHPCQFNDDLSGVAVILELFRWLAARKTRYSYRAVLGPEHLGTVFYLAGLPKRERMQLKLAVFVEMAGTRSPLSLQKSFTGTTILDRVAEWVLRRASHRLRVGPFRTIVGNDETVWEAPGIEVPCISVSRCHRPGYYNEYHTSADTVSAASFTNLGQTLQALKDIVSIFENDRLIKRRFSGLVALSNPKFGLYVDRPDPSVRRVLTAEDRRMGQLQDYLPRYCDGSHTIFEIAEAWGIPFGTLHLYLSRMQACNLIQLEPLPSLGSYGECWQKAEAEDVPTSSQY